MGPLNSHPALSLTTLLSSLLRRCVQCRNRRPVWAPKANHKQLCVGHLRPSAYRPSIGGPETTQSGLRVLGTYSTKEHTTRCLFLSLGDAAEIHISTWKAATIAETLLTRSKQVPADSTHFLFFTLDDNKREYIMWWSKIQYIDFCEREQLVPWVSYSKHVLMKDVIVAVTKMLQRQRGCWLLLGNLEKILKR